MTTNQPYTIADYNREIDKLADQEGKGAVARPEFYVQTARFAHLGVISPENARDAWSRFQSKKDKRADGIALVSERQRVSELRQIITAGMAAQSHPKAFYETLVDAKPIIFEMKAAGSLAPNMRTQDAFVKLARHQIEVKDRPLTEDDVREALTVVPKDKDTSEVASLEKIIKALQRHMDGKAETDTSPGIPAYGSEEAGEALRLLTERKAALEYAATRKGRRKAAA